MQPPPTNGAGARNKLKNPLLSAAADDYPFTFPESTLLMPVTPATPAILQDEPAAAPAEIDPTFLGQHQPPTLSHPGSFPPQQNPSPAPPAPAQRQGYFTSILSSLPNLSLSAITGESPQQQPTPPQQTYGAPTYGGPSPYDIRGGQQSDFNAGLVATPPPLQQPGPPPSASAPPPSGGSVGSYRLGNQRRLKYAPLPDLAQSAAAKLPYQATPPFPPQPSHPVGPPPAFFNPNIQQQKNSPSPSAPVGTPSSHGSSLHNSFRNSPVAPPTSSYPAAVGFNLPGATVPSKPSYVTSPQAIPSRVPEPATPQNTPADAFSGFGAYRQQQQFPNSYNFNEPPKPTVVQPPTILNPGQQDSDSRDRTFTPISAAQVTEKLENLIAEQNDDSLSIKSELSAEVANITANIQSSSKQPESEELTEIDLSSSSDSYPVTSEIKFDDSDLSESLIPQPPQLYQHQQQQDQYQQLQQQQQQLQQQKQQEEYQKHLQQQKQLEQQQQDQYLQQQKQQEEYQKQLEQQQQDQYLQQQKQQEEYQKQLEQQQQDQYLQQQKQQEEYQKQLQQQKLQEQQQQDQYHQQQKQQQEYQIQLQQEQQKQQERYLQRQEYHKQLLQQEQQKQQQQQEQYIQQQNQQEEYKQQLQQQEHQEQQQQQQDQYRQQYQQQQQKQQEEYQKQLQQQEQQEHQQENRQQHLQQQKQQKLQEDERLKQQQLQEQQQPTHLPVPSATSFFVSPPGNSQNVPTFYSTPLQQQSVSDPFSFVQTKSEKSTAGSPNLVEAPLDSLRQGVNSESSETPVGRGGELGYAAGGDLSQHSIWGPTQNQNHQNQSFSQHPQQPSQQPKQASEQPVPTFFNPVQFSSTSQTYSPISSPNNYVPTPIGSSHSGAFGNLTYHQPATIHETFNAVPEPTGSATLSPVQMSVNPLTSSRSPSQETVPQSLQNLASGLPERQMQYRPVYHHWFYRREVETKTLWLPFSMHDSLNLEEVHNSNEISPETKVATDGGRYDVEILRRQRSPVYWTGPTTEVRRCSWFYKGPAESRYTPYEESVSARLEEEFKHACTNNSWNRRVDLNNGEYIIFHSASVQVHYQQASTPELTASWGNNSGSEDNAYLQSGTSRHRVVKRGMDEFNIDDGEPEKVDHLLFLVHGIGSVCDLKFRTVEEVVDEFRSISLQLVQSHYRNSSEQGIVNRIEVLPISWHATLHSGIDKKLQVISLESIPKLRHFTNDTLLDILFYTSPIYCETIMQTVGTEMNRLYSLFNQRNPEFQGNVYLGGHSLGSLIVFDLLCHQKPEPETEEPETNGETVESNETSNKDGVVTIKPLAAPVLKRKLSKKVSYVMGTAGTGQPFINYPQLAFNPRAFFALGSPIGMFVTVRGIDNLGEDFNLPTCPAFFNIFHPFDPVAYRVESLINPEAHKYRPMLIPHHKGRKRMHLELKETMARVGADLKQRLLESVRNTWNSVYQLAMFHKQDNQTLEQEIEKVVEEQMNNPRPESLQTASDDAGHDIKIGKLNGGRRIDYVLQEAPFEYINEYLFALSSHVCYWESEDTMLMILKEIYGSMGIQTDAQLPQQSLSIERVATPSFSTNNSNVASPTTNYGMDPTVPIGSSPVGPPPVSGFVKKS